MIHYEDFERGRLDPIYDSVAPYSEMMKNERYFLNGIIRSMKPKKILEVGVSSGGGTALILNAIRDIDGAELYSVDYMQNAYRYPEKPSGFLVEEKFPELIDKWHVFRGGDVSRYVDKIGGNIDLLVLDTMHVHPWETLNFLCVLPFMKKDSFAVLHDISSYQLSYSAISTGGLACRYLFSDVVSDEKFSPVSDYGDIPANIGAFKVSEVTVKYAGNLFENLLIPWQAEVSEGDYDDMRKIIEKYYTPEQYKFFCEAFAFQKYLAEKKRQKVNFSSLLKFFIQTWKPGLFAGIRSVKKFLKGKRS